MLRWFVTHVTYHIRYVVTVRPYSIPDLPPLMPFVLIYVVEATVIDCSVVLLIWYGDIDSDARFGLLVICCCSLLSGRYCWAIDLTTIDCSIPIDGNLLVLLLLLFVTGDNLVPLLFIVIVLLWRWLSIVVGVVPLFTDPIPTTPPDVVRWFWLLIGDDIPVDPWRYFLYVDDISLTFVTVVAIVVDSTRRAVDVWAVFGIRTVTFGIDLQFPTVMPPHSTIDVTFDDLFPVLLFYPTDLFVVTGGYWPGGIDVTLLIVTLPIRTWFDRLPATVFPGDIGRWRQSYDYGDLLLFYLLFQSVLVFRRYYIPDCCYSVVGDGGDVLVIPTTLHYNTICWWFFILTLMIGPIVISDLIIRWPHCYSVTPLLIPDRWWPVIPDCCCCCLIPHCCSGLTGDGGKSIDTCCSHSTFHIVQWSPPPPTIAYLPHIGVGRPDLHVTGTVPLTHLTTIFSYVPRSGEFPVICRSRCYAFHYIWRYHGYALFVAYHLPSRWKFLTRYCWRWYSDPVPDLHCWLTLRTVLSVLDVTLPTYTFTLTCYDSYGPVITDPSLFFCWITGDDTDYVVRNLKVLLIDVRYGILASSGDCWWLLLLCTLFRLRFGDVVNGDWPVLIGDELRWRYSFVVPPTIVGDVIVDRWLRISIATCRYYDILIPYLHTTLPTVHTTLHYTHHLRTVLLRTHHTPPTTLLPTLHSLHTPHPSTLPHTWPTRLFVPITVFIIGDFVVLMVGPVMRFRWCWCCW